VGGRQEGREGGRQGDNEREIGIKGKRDKGRKGRRGRLAGRRAGRQGAGEAGRQGCRRSRARFRARRPRPQSRDIYVDIHIYVIYIYIERERDIHMYVYIYVYMYIYMYRPIIYIYMHTAMQRLAVVRRLQVCDEAFRPESFLDVLCRRATMGFGRGEKTTQTLRGSFLDVPKAAKSNGKCENIVFEKALKNEDSAYLMQGALYCGWGWKLWFPCLSQWASWDKKTTQTFCCSFLETPKTTKPHGKCGKVAPEKTTKNYSNGFSSHPAHRFALASQNAQHSQPLFQADRFRPSHPRLRVLKLTPARAHL